MSVWDKALRPNPFCPPEKTIMNLLNRILEDFEDLRQQKEEEYNKSHDQEDAGEEQGVIESIKVIEEYKKFYEQD